MADLDEVAALLHVFEKANAHGDLLKNIAANAMMKLKQIDAEHAKPVPVVEAEPEAQPEPLEDIEHEPEHEQETEDHGA